MNSENIEKCIQKIGDRIKEYDIGRSAGQAIVTTAIEQISPNLALVIEPLKTIANYSDQIKLNSILKGLSNGENVETKLNELYLYVSNQERAFYVSTTFKQMLLSQSPIACTIMGIILGEKSKYNRDLSYEDIVLLKAIESITDFELRGFLNIMQNGIGKNDHINCKNLSENDYNYICRWCVANQIFSTSNIGISGTTMVIGTNYIATDNAKKLMDYILKAQQLLRYSE